MTNCCTTSSRNKSTRVLISTLMGRYLEIFDFKFFQELSFPGSLITGSAKSIFSKICEDICNSGCNTGANDTGSKWEKC
jgi:hypothetical protein